MKSTGLARRVAAAGAGVAMVATMAVGLAAAPAAAASAGASTASKGAGKAVLATTPVASPRNFKGECPVTVTFSSKIKVKVEGKTTVAYRWLHGDGSKSKVKTLTLRGKGTKSVTVKEKATFKKDVKGWQALQVLKPRKTTTKKRHFSVDCGKSDALVDRSSKSKSKYAKAYVDVPNFDGICKPYSQVTAKGVIRVGKPTWVKYRWIHNGKVVDHGKTKVWRAKKVSYSFAPRHSHKGWVALDIVSPRYGGHDRDFYTVDCAKPPVKKPVDHPKPAKAWASVSGAGSYEGTCPVDRTFTGTVSVNRASVVKYRWAGHGYRGPVETLVFGKFGPKSKTVSHTVKFTDSGVAKRWIEVLGPNHSVSNVGVAKAQCAKPAPAATPTATPTVTVTATPVPA